MQDNRQDRNRRTIDVKNDPENKKPASPSVLKGSAGNENADLAAKRAPGKRKNGEDMEERQEQILDEAIEETFPASDPITPKQIT